MMIITVRPIDLNLVHPLLDIIPYLRFRWTLSCIPVLVSGLMAIFSFSAIELLLEGEDAIWL